jgi:AcrR family transcriptional regulator
LDVRQSILKAGASLLKDHGIAALTQPRVARGAGIKQSHLTYYFPKRADLLLGIAQHAIDSVMADLATRLTAEPAQAVLTQTIGSAMAGGIPPRIMIGLIVAADEEPSLRPALRKLVRDVRTRIQAVLQRAGMDAGDEAALLFHAAMVGLALMNEARRTPESAREMQDGIAAMLRLLQTGAAKRAAGTVS